jgi:hypothetical protein
VDSRTGEAQESWTVPSTSRQNNQFLAFSPDLMTMYFSQKDPAACRGPDCTWVMRARDLPTGRDREIFRIRAVSLRYIAISADGRELAFTAFDGGRGRGLMAVPTAGGQPREFYRFPDEVNYDMNIAWTQDGRHVLAFRPLPNGGEVWSIPTNGGSPEKSPLRIRPSEGKKLSPDGTQIAFVGGNRSSEIWVMTGLFQDAKPAVVR